MTTDFLCYAFDEFKQLGADYTIEGEGYEIHAEKLSGADIFLDEASVTGTENIVMAAVLAEGTTTGSYKIPAQGSTVIPISVTADAYQIFSSTGLEAVKSFIGTVTNNSTTSSRLAVKVKPTIEMGASTVTLPFISLASN